MALIIATGSNLGDRIQNLNNVKNRLSEDFKLIAQSKIYTSGAVDYLEQPDFANQVLQFALPWQSPVKVMEQLLQIEKEFGRTRDVSRGPRIIDIDIIFWGIEFIHSPSLDVPHPRWDQRSFVVRPLMELPFFHLIEKCFTIPSSFEVEAFPI